MKDKLTIINCKEHDKAVCDHSDYYGETMTERRERFNNIINGINMVLMNNIVDVDDTVLDNWLQRNPMGNDECEFQYPYTDGKHCIVHDKKLQ